MDDTFDAHDLVVKSTDEEIKCKDADLEGQNLDINGSIFLVLFLSERLWSHIFSHTCASFKSKNCCCK